MDAGVRRGCRGLAVLFMLAAVSCGGGGGGSGSSSTTGSVAAASNVVSVVVDSGPNQNSFNTLFTTVTVCVPGSTTKCQTIDHIQVDTASFGLRILAPVLTLTLPIKQASDGNSLVECTQFVGVYSWGPVASADVQISGETAAAVPVQVIGDSNYSSVPAACSSTGTAEDTVATFGANGILGIGVFAQDCGSGCVTSTTSGDYYSCSQAACNAITVTLANQVQNPVTLFAVDNNGTLLDLPGVSNSGAATVTGSLIFGIDTETNNGSGTQTLLTVDPSSGYITITYDGTALDESFIDSGTNGIYFKDTAKNSVLTPCTATGYTDFYCPTSTQTLNATLTGVNGKSAMLSFSVGNAQTLLSTTDTALPSVAGTFSQPTSTSPSTSTSTSTPTFDWGLAFYYGRRVATAIENHSSSAGTGPYIAF